MKNKNAEDLKLQAGKLALNQVEKPAYVKYVELYNQSIIVHLRSRGEDVEVRYNLEFQNVI